MFLSLLTVLIFISILVLVHESGHFFTAKKFGLWVREFGFGLPPQLWSKKINNTIYSLNWLPFGGFVKILGEDGEGGEDKKEEGKVLYAEEKIEIIETADSSLRYQEAEVVSFSSGERRSFLDLPIWKRSVIIFAGVFMNFILGWLLLSVIFMTGVSQSLIITDIAKLSPAETAGLKIGDRIIEARFNNEKLLNEIKASNFTEFINIFKAKEISLRIEREDKKIDVRIIPRENPPVGQGALGIVIAESGIPRLNFFEALRQGFMSSVKIIQMIFLAIFDLISKAFSGKASLEEISGPVGIFKLTNEATKSGFLYIINLLAFISFNLAVVNILPFPALDGGRLLFLFIEKIKGSPLPKKFEKYANAFGMAFLLFLIAVITIKDVIRLF